MRRFILLTLLGGFIALVGHGLISFGLHPERLAPVPALLQGCAVLVIGAALFCTGMIGLVDGYERVAAQVHQLLEQKDVSQASSRVVVTDRTALEEANQRFWRGYSRAGLGLCIFLAGLLAAVAALSSVTPALFTVTVGVIVVILFFSAATICGRGLTRLRGAHADVDTSGRLLARLPDYRPEPVSTPRRRRTTRLTLFPRATVTRGLDQQTPPKPETTVPSS